MNIWITLPAILIVAVIIAVAYRIGRNLAIRDLHIAAGRRLTRAEHRQMGQLMDKALNEDDPS